MSTKAATDFVFPGWEMTEVVNDLRYDQFILQHFQKEINRRLRAWSPGGKRVGIKAQKKRRKSYERV